MKAFLRETNGFFQAMNYNLPLIGRLKKYMPFLGKKWELQSVLRPALDVGNPSSSGLNFQKAVRQ